MAKASDFLVALDDGHGMETAGKRTPVVPSLGRQIRENEFNRAVVNLLNRDLKRIGFRTLLTAPNDVDIPLRQRTDTANRSKADLLISVHYNAIATTFNASKASGFSVHIQPNSSAGSVKFAQFAIEELAKGTAQVNRGVVRQDLHMTRETKMPAALIEAGFMDDEREALLMINAEFQREVAEELARAVCRYFGVPYSAEVSTATVPQNKEGQRMFKPSTKTLENEMIMTIEMAHKNGILSSDQWAQKAREGNLTLDDATALVATIVRRTNVEKMNS